MSYSNLENLQKNHNEKYFSSRNKQQMITKETYIKKKFLGEGSFGVANLIQSNLTNIEYVCKDIDLSDLNEESEKKALAEVSVLRKCKHPNIISFKEVFITRKPQRVLHLITEYADSGDLGFHLIKQKEKKEYFEEKLIINWLIQTCLGLKYIHNLHVIHRDMKPQNIFLTKKGIIKIGDFGISKVLDRNHSDTKTQIGTPLYMPPEIINTQKYDYKADIWSLGVTFFELINFYRPYGGNNPIGLYRNIVEGKNQIRISKNNNVYSKELIDVINKMISRDPNKRPTLDEILNVPIINKHLKEFLKKNKNLYNGVDLHLNENYKEKKNKSINDKNISEKYKFNNYEHMVTINEENENEEKKSIKHLTQQISSNSNNSNNINDCNMNKTQNTKISYFLFDNNY